MGNSILERLKCQNFKDIFPSPIMHVWKGEYPPLATDTEVNSCFSLY